MPRTDGAAELPQHHAAAAFSRPASPDDSLAAPLLAGGANGDARASHRGADTVFEVMKFFVWAVGTGATTVRVPLYHAESSEVFEEVPGRSPCYPRFWRSVCCGQQAEHEAPGETAPVMQTSLPRCAWWLLRGLLVAWPCVADIFFLVKMGGIVSGGSVEENPGVPTHAWQHDGTHAPMRIIPDTSGNFLSFPVHLLGVGALWFVGTSRTQIIWHRLLRAEEADQDKLHGSQASALHFTIMLSLVILSGIIFFMRYTRQHVFFWSDKDKYWGGNPTWWTPEMSVDFSQGAPMPPLEVILSIVSELTCIATFAASGTIFATIYLRTDATKVRFMQLLEDHVTLNHRRLVNDSVSDDGTDSRRFAETISAPIQSGLPRPPAAFNRAPRQPSAGIDDFVASGTLTRTTTTIKSQELDQGECLPALVLEEHFLRVVRAVGTMDTLLNRVLSYFAVCLLAAVVCTTYLLRTIYMSSKSSNLRLIMNQFVTCLLSGVGTSTISRGRDRSFRTISTESRFCCCCCLRSSCRSTVFSSEHAPTLSTSSSGRFATRMRAELLPTLTCRKGRTCSCG